MFQYPRIKEPKNGVGDCASIADVGGGVRSQESTSLLVLIAEYEPLLILHI